MFAMGSVEYSPNAGVCPTEARLIAELEVARQWVDSISKEHRNSMMVFDGARIGRDTQALTMARRSSRAALDALKEHLFEHEW